MTNTTGIENGLKTRFTSERVRGMWEDPEHRKIVSEKISKSLQGKSFTEEHKKKLRKPKPSISGKNHYRWNGGKTKTTQGYIAITVDGKRIYEHRYIMEKYLGRKLRTNESIHHINGIKTDNRIENLALTNKKNHPNMHRKYIGCKKSGCKNDHWTHGYCHTHSYNEYYKKLKDKLGDVIA
jgi:hypothetical protein